MGHHVGHASDDGQRLGAGDLLTLFVELLLEPPTLADIDDRAQYQPALRDFDLGEADLHRTLAAVLAHAVQVAADAHAPGLMVLGKERIPLLRVHAAFASGHQHIDGMTHQLVAWITEQHLGVCVGKNDAPRLVHHHERTGCGFGGDAKSLIAQ